MIGMNKKPYICKHCNDIFLAFAEENEEYCPSCRAVIFKALSEVPLKRKEVYVAIEWFNNEDFETKLKKSLLQLYTVVYSNATVEDIAHHGYSLRRITKKEDGSSIICAKAWLTVESDQIETFYGDPEFPVVNKEKAQEGYKKYLDFTKDFKNPFVKKIEDVKECKMSPPTDKISYLKSYYMGIDKASGKDYSTINGEIVNV